MLILYGVLDGLYFTAAVCLRVVMAFAELAYTSWLVLASIMSSQLSVAGPAALNALEYGFFGVSYALGVTANVS